VTECGALLLSTGSSAGSDRFGGARSGRIELRASCAPWTSRTMGSRYPLPRRGLPCEVNDLWPLLGEILEGSRKTRLARGFDALPRTEHASSSGSRVDRSRSRRGADPGRWRRSRPPRGWRRPFGFLASRSPALPVARPHERHAQHDVAPERGSASPLRMWTVPREQHEQSAEQYERSGAPPSTLRLPTDLHPTLGRPRQCDQRHDLPASVLRLPVDPASGDRERHQRLSGPSPTGGLSVRASARREPA